MRQLRRHIGTFDALFYGLGVIIGAGIYVLVAPASGFSGNAIWLSFLIGGFLALFTGMAYAELGSMFPKAAAEYVYMKRAYKSHISAFMLGWLIIFTTMVSISTVGLGFTGYLADLVGVTQEESRHLVPLITIAMIATMGGVNFLSIRSTSKINIAITSVVILGLVIVIGLAGYTGSFGKIDYFNMPHGMSGVFIASTLIFFAFLGFEEIVNIAEETRRPHKVLPKAIIMAAVVSTVLYMVTSMSLVSLEGWESLSKSKAPLADAVHGVLGHEAGVVMSLIAMFATSSTVLGMILVASRMMWGMSKEGALPKFLSRVGSRGVPNFSILVIVIGSIIFVLAGDITHIANITSAGALIIFLNMNLAVIWLRYTQPEARRPFKMPLNIGRYPVMAGIGVFISILMLMQLDLSVFWVAAIIVAIGAVVFLIYKRREYPLISQARVFVMDLKREAER
jgi:APA family basic amino acid/polyamine antiporter